MKSILFLVSFLSFSALAELSTCHLSAKPEQDVPFTTDQFLQVRTLQVCVQKAMLLLNSDFQFGETTMNYKYVKFLYTERFYEISGQIQHQK